VLVSIAFGQESYDNHFSVPVIKYLKKQLKGGMIYLGSPFQMFQSMITWFCCF
jgi:hypothetical protein